MAILKGDFQYKGKTYSYQIDIDSEDELNSDSPIHSIYVEYRDENDNSLRTIWFYKKETLYAALKRSVDTKRASWSNKA